MSVQSLREQVRHVCPPVAIIHAEDRVHTAIVAHFYRRSSYCGRHTLIVLQTAGKQFQSHLRHKYSG